MKTAPTERRSPWVWLLPALIFFSILAYWSASYLELSGQKLVSGFPNLLSFIGRMFPPEWSAIPGLLPAILSTLLVAVWETFLAMILGTALALGAARNLFGSNIIVYGACRAVLSVLRALPDMIWALIFVAAVGLGPFPGVLALTVYSTGELGKLYAESAENIDPGPREAIDSTGATSLKTFRWAVVPQVLPEFVTYSLYRFESNVRHAFVLGLVGAGGIGFELNVAMRLYQYQRVGAILIVIVLTVALIDFASSRIRSRII
ncbi:phosphonate ABC transporter, permease protein PhnE [Corynebacterium appendicis]|uniref:phosphonate ABC transporter, permease protein PhnE n=1 Tax=Corynebacterium appendicis TaxID=163202 RepID=UPI0021AFEE55|nr:phosphonate ABC transporter, permease protein PhnE [Corynebacterium appendicis]MCT1685229.1 phosphonate ABC transporter, permease protein PhnE [Corynebacterium appendicis]